MILSGQYSYVDASFDRGAFTDNRIPFVAKQNGRLTASCEPRKAWTLLAEIQCIGDRIASGDYANALEKLPAYMVFNLNANFRRSAWLTSEENVRERYRAPWPTISGTGRPPATGS